LRLDVVEYLHGKAAGEVDVTEASATGREEFTGELWRFIEDIYARILAHRLLTSLADGTRS
jgi:hypothetical protein